MTADKNRIYQDINFYKLSKNFTIALSSYYYMKSEKEKKLMVKKQFSLNVQKFKLMDYI